MSKSIQSLISTGTKLYLDSVDPELVDQNIAWGAVGATSNPIIISELIKSGAYDDQISEMLDQGKSDYDICWAINDKLVSEAEQKFLPVWERTKGNAGYVSFELDPLVDDQEGAMAHDKRVREYVRLGEKWSAGHKNRMIKVPATPAGIESLEPLAERGIALNVTLVFTQRQYEAARSAVWRGAQRCKEKSKFKSVYSIFVSRIDQYTGKHCPGLSKEAQGEYGILNAKRIFAENEAFWRQHELPLEQEIIFASTGTKDPKDPAWKYVQALAGANIQTNPPATNEAVANSGVEFTSRVRELPSDKIQQELDAAVNVEHLEETLMTEGLEKFATPQKRLLQTIANHREKLRA